MKSVSRIDWTRPCYAVTPFGGRTHDDCAVCGLKLEKGEQVQRGPRGRIIVHAECVGTLKAGEPS
jgi:hypothetical protein